MKGIMGMRQAVLRLAAFALPAAAVAAFLVPQAPGGTGAPPVRIQAVELSAEDPMPGGTFVVLVNTGAKPISLACWRVVTRRATLVIRQPARLGPGRGLRLLFDRGQVANPDRIRLVRRDGRLADATPVLHDTQADDRLFARGANGWTLGRAPLPERLTDGKLGVPGTSGC